VGSSDFECEGMKTRPVVDSIRGDGRDVEGTRRVLHWRVTSELDPFEVG
jgi:hypothetical protein